MKQVSSDVNLIIPFFIRLADRPVDYNENQ
jgi:hypothetical protein